MSKILHIFLVLLFSLTTISILLPSSPLFAEESGTLYPWETSSGNVWKSFGDVRYQPQYKGEILNGNPMVLVFCIMEILIGIRRMKFTFFPQEVGTLVSGKMEK